MRVSRLSFVVAIGLGGASLAHAQSAPGNPLSPAAGYAAQQAGVLPIGSQPAILGKGQYLLATLSSDAIPGKSVTSLRYGVTDRLSIGLAYLRQISTFRPDVSYTVVPETVELPSFNVGTFHDTVDGGRQAYYATAARTIIEMGNMAFSGYVGIAKYSSEGTSRPLLGVALPFAQGKVTASAQWESKKLQIGLVADVGKVAGYGLRLGVVAVGDSIGPFAATTWRH